MKNRFTKYRVILTTLSVFAVFAKSTLLFAQSGISNARSVAMGGAYTALARGVEAPAWNPANLALSGENIYHFNLISVGVGFHNNSFSKKQYNLYNGRFLTPEDKQNILTSIPSQGLRVDFDTEVQAMSISLGSFAFTATGLAASDFTLSKDIVDLVLNGNEFNRTYNIGATGGEGWGISSFGLSAAFPISIPAFHEFTLGASFKYLKGFAYGKVKEASSTIMTEVDGIHGTGRVVIDRALGGSGLAFDFGTAASLNKKWSMSLSVTNLFNFINWGYETKRFTYAFTADSLSIEKIEDTDIDSVFSDSKQTTDIESFNTTLPSELRLGIARTTKRLLLAVDIVQGLKKRAGVSTTPKIALGTELRLIHFFPMRAGFSIGGKRGFSSSAGFALDFSIFSWDFAVSNQGGLFSGRGLGVAFAWMFRF
ncbi:MAG: DUF5723 family protein [bacterium]